MNTAASILSVVGCLPYIWAIVNHQTVPSPVSWVIWASVDVLALVAMWKKKALNGQIVGAVVAAGLTACFALFFGKPTVGLIEWISIAIALASVILWQVKSDAIYGIVGSQVAIAAGAIPTIVGAYHNPTHENPIAWLIWLSSCICVLFAIKKWDLANALQPLTFTVNNTIMVFLVTIRPLWP